MTINRQKMNMKQQLRKDRAMRRAIRVRDGVTSTSQRAIQVAIKNGDYFKAMVLTAPAKQLRPNSVFVPPDSKVVYDFKEAHKISIRKSGTTGHAGFCLGSHFIWGVNGFFPSMLDAEVAGLRYWQLICTHYAQQRIAEGEDYHFPDWPEIFEHAAPYKSKRRVAGLNKYGVSRAPLPEAIDLLEAGHSAEPSTAAVAKKKARRNHELKLREERRANRRGTSPDLARRGEP